MSGPPPPGLDDFLDKGVPPGSPPTPEPPGLDRFLGPDQKQLKYGTTEQQVKTALEGAARGVSLGTSDYAETRLGIADPQDIRARQEANPGTSFAGNAVGTGALIYGTGGLAAPAEGAMLAAKVAPLAARGLAYGAEGALLGAGNTVSDAALGDTNINAQKILSDVGFGFAMGSGLGLLSKGIEATPALMKKSGTPLPESVLTGESSVNTNRVVDAPSTQEPGALGITPTTLDEIQARVKDASYRGEDIELPQKKALEDAASRVPMMNPIHPLQLESLESQGSRDLYKTAMEMPGKEGDALRNYEGLQKNELTKRTDQTIKDIVPGYEPKSDAVQGGQQAIDAFTENYKQEKDALAPAFQALKKADLGDINHLPGVISKFTDAVPGVARMFDTEANDIAIKSYKPSWGIDKATYSAVKNVVEDLKEGPKNFEELSNLRKSLDQHVDILSKGQAPQEIMALKKSMMDYLQDVLEKSNASEEVPNVREIFKRYAINEQERGVVEKAFGASVGSPEFGQISKIKPEDISDRIFKNTATVKAARNILGEEEFNKLLANHLAEQKALATDKGVFSSNKFGSYLRKNQDALNEAFQNNQAGLQKLKDVNNIMRILPDSASINPSGTAKTLWGILHAHSTPELLANAKEFGQDYIQKKFIASKINAELAGKADQAKKLSVIQKMLGKTGKEIEDGAKSIFGGPSGRGAFVGGLTSVASNAYREKIDKIRAFASDPNALMNHLHQNTDAMYAAAPNITQSLHNTITTGIDYLNSKIPKPNNQFPLSTEFKPSPAAISKFNKYYNAVNDPIEALYQVKHGNLTNETLEALQAVHPQLLQEMQKKVLENFEPEKAQKLPYSTRISLGKFLNEPLDEHMLPQTIMSYQQSLSGPQLSQQAAPKMSRAKPTASGMKHLNPAKLTATQTNPLNDES